jgi:hypothetical protein
MRKAFLAYSLILILIFLSACKAKEEPKDYSALDPYLTEHPTEALLEDIYGLDTHLTSGKIIYLHKYYDPKEEVLTYDVTYDKSGGMESFIKNTEELFEMSIPKVSENSYSVKNKQIHITIRFDEDDRVSLSVKIYSVYNSIVFPYIDNEYPDRIIKPFPEWLNVFSGVRGLEYDSEQNTLTFERYWILDNEYTDKFIGHYETVYKDNHEKTSDDETRAISVTSRYNDHIRFIASSIPLSENEFLTSFNIEYDLSKISE